MATADSMARAAAAKRAATAAAAAKKKRQAVQKSTVKTSADRAEALKRTQTRAGKGSGNVAQRAKQNAGVKDGTIRLGAKGKSYNIWDAKTQTWKRGIVSAGSKPKTAKPNVQKPKISSKTVEPRTDRLSKPFPHKEGYKTLGAEGNKWVSKKTKKDIKPEEKRGKPGGTRTFIYGRGGEKQTAFAKRGWKVTKKW